MTLKDSVISAKIKRKKWKAFRDHALERMPEECIGLFECLEHNGKYEITNVYPCRNVARNKKIEGKISKPEMRELKKLISRGERKGFKYGIYHSHPLSGSVSLSDVDQFISKIYKLFRMQIILGVTGKRVKKAFWIFQKPNLIEGRIEVI